MGGFEKINKKERFMLIFSASALVGLCVFAVFIISESGFVGAVLEKSSSSASVGNMSLGDVDVTIVPLED